MSGIESLKKYDTFNEQEEKDNEVIFKYCKIISKVHALHLEGTEYLASVNLGNS